MYFLRPFGLTFLALSLSGCFFYTPDKSDITISCNTDADCGAVPERPICAPHLLICVATSDLDTNAPRLLRPVLTPATAGPADTLKLVFEMSEAVSEVEVFIELGDVQPRWSLVEQTDDVYEFAFNPSDFAIVSGSYPVTVRAIDPSLNEVAIEAATAVFDFEGASIIAPTLSARLVSLTETAKLQFSTTESVSQTPSVSSSLNSGGEVLDWSVQTARDGSFVATLEGDATQTDGEYAISIALTDSSGNDSVASNIGTIIVDHTPPTVAQFAVSKTEYQLAEPFVATILSSEPLREVTSLTLRHQSSGETILVEGDITGSGETVVFTTLFGDTEDGFYDIEGGELTDLAGNSATADVSGTIRVDATAPSISNFGQSHVVARGSDLFSVWFTPTEPLSAAPSVKVTGGATGVEITMAHTAGDPMELDELHYEVDLNTAPSTAGVHEIRLLLTDTAGLIASEIPGTVDIDSLPPQVETAGFSPAFAASGQLVTLLVVPSEALSAPPILHFLGANPGFVAGVSTGAGEVFSFTIPQSFSDTAIVLTGIEATDLAGNSQLTTVNHTLTIDGTSPIISNISSDRDVYSELPGFDTATISFDVSEPIPTASVNVTVGSATLNCGAYQAASPNYSCSGKISDPTVAEDTFLIVQVAARDAAGNLADDGVSTVLYDVTAPEVLLNTVQLDVLGIPESIPGLLPDRLHHGTTASVRFATSEPLVNVPAARLAPSSISLQSISSSSLVNQFEFSYTRGAELNAGTYNVTVDMADRAGHTAVQTIALSLVAPEFVETPCPAQDSTGAFVPTDFDGDGYPGWGPGCDSLLECSDCDDTDATRYAGAFEIFGDGIDNSCTGGSDVAPSDDNSVFLLAGGGSGGNGTMSAPFRSFAEAAAVAESAGKVLIMAAGVVEFDDQQMITREYSMYGGFDATTWTITDSSARTTLHTDQPLRLNLFILGQSILVGRTIFDGINFIKAGSGFAMLVDSTLHPAQNGSAHYITAPTLMLRSEALSTVYHDLQGRSTKVVDSELQQTQHVGPGNFTSLRNHMRADISVEQSRYVTNAIYLNNIIESSSYNGFELSAIEGNFVAIGNTVMSSQDGAASVQFGEPFNDTTDSPGMLHFLNNAFLIPSTPLWHVVLREHSYVPAGLSFRLYGNAASGGVDRWFVPQSGQPNDAFIIAATPENDCSRGAGDPCIDSAMNMTTIEQSTSLPLSLSPGSDLVGSGVNAADYVAFTLEHTAAASDFFGACRSQNAPTIGAVEP